MAEGLKSSFFLTTRFIQFRVQGLAKSSLADLRSAIFSLPLVDTYPCTFRDTSLTSHFLSG